jgi:hypothetical protein
MADCNSDRSCAPESVRKPVADGPENRSRKFTRGRADSHATPTPGISLIVLYCYDTAKPPTVNSKIMLVFCYPPMEVPYLWQ